MKLSMTGCENKNIILKAYAWDGEKENSKARVSMDRTVLTCALTVRPSWTRGDVSVGASARHRGLDWAKLAAVAHVMKTAC